MRPVNAFIRSGRDNVIVATPSSTSYKISEYSMIQNVPIRLST